MAFLLGDMRTREDELDRRITTLVAEFATVVRTENWACRLTGIFPAAELQNATALIAAVGSAATFSKGHIYRNRYPHSGMPSDLLQSAHVKPRSQQGRCAEARRTGSTGSLGGMLESFMCRCTLGKVLAAIQRYYFSGHGSVVDEIADGAAEIGEIGRATER